MVELRKRKAPPPPPPPTPAKRSKKAATSKSKASPKKAEASEAPKVETSAADSIPVPNGNPDAPKFLLGYTITLDSFGGEVQTHDEKNVTLAQLVEKSKAGVVLFTYPKASTPGCMLL